MLRLERQAWKLLSTMTLKATKLSEMTWGETTRVSNPHAAQDGYEHGPTQNRGFTLNRFFAHRFSLACVCLMCGSRQLFFQCGRDTRRLDALHSLHRETRQGPKGET